MLNASQINLIILSKYKLYHIKPYLPNSNISGLDKKPQTVNQQSSPCISLPFLTFRHIISNNRLSFSFNLPKLLLSMRYIASIGIFIIRKIQPPLKIRSVQIPSTNKKRNSEVQFLNNPSEFLSFSRLWHCKRTFLYTVM